MVFAETTCLPLIHSPRNIQITTVFSGRGVEINFILHRQRKYEKVARLGSPIFTTQAKKRRDVSEGVCVLLITHTEDELSVEHLWRSLCLGYHTEQLT